MTYTFLDMNVRNLSVGHFEFMVVEAVAAFKSGASPFKIVIHVKREPYANKISHLSPIIISHLTTISIPVLYPMLPIYSYDLSLIKL